MNNVKKILKTDFTTSRLGNQKMIPNEGTREEKHEKRIKPMWKKNAELPIIVS